MQHAEEALASPSKRLRSSDENYDDEGALQMDESASVISEGAVLPILCSVIRPRLGHRLEQLYRPPGTSCSDDTSAEAELCTP